MDAVRLVNFRSFRDTGWVPIKPLTVLVGKNSSGKSSFARFFPLMRQSVQSRTQGALLWYGEDVDFGKYEDVRHRGAGDAEIGFGVEVNGVKVYSRIELINNEEKISSIKIGIFNFNLINDNYIMNIDNIDNIDLRFVEYSKFMYPLLMLNDDFLQDENNLDDRELETKLLFFANKFHNMSFEKNSKTRIVEIISVFEKIYNNFVKKIHAISGNVIYLGPFRAYPERYYRKQNIQNHFIDSSGSNFPMFLRSLNVEERKSFSNWVYENLKFYVNLHEERDHIQILIQEEGMLPDNLLDVGFGVSQILPIIAQLWLTQYYCVSGFIEEKASKSESLVVVIEQPELHLHPAMQARLGRALARVAKAGREMGIRLIVETHSQIVVNEIGACVEEEEIAAEDVAVLLFEKQDQDTTIRTATFNREGVLENWPFGFFQPDAPARP